MSWDSFTEIIKRKPFRPSDEQDLARFINAHRNQITNYNGSVWGANSCTGLHYSAYNCEPQSLCSLLKYAPELACKFNSFGNTALVYVGQRKIGGAATTILSYFSSLARILIPYEVHKTNSGVCGVVQSILSNVPEVFFLLYPFEKDIMYKGNDISYLCDEKNNKCKILCDIGKTRSPVPCVRCGANNIELCDLGVTHDVYCPLCKDFYCGAYYNHYQTEHDIDCKKNFVCFCGEILPTLDYKELSNHRCKSFTCVCGKVFPEDTSRLEDTEKHDSYMLNLLNHYLLFSLHSSIQRHYIYCKENKLDFNQIAMAEDYRRSFLASCTDKSESNHKYVRCQICMECYQEYEFKKHKEKCINESRKCNINDCTYASINGRDFLLHKILDHYDYISDLQGSAINCPFYSENTKEGCKFCGTIQEVRKHLISECLYVATHHCENVNCPFKGTIGEVKAHTQYCEYNYVQCHYCKQLFIKKNIEEHEKQDCIKSQEIVPCSYKYKGCEEMIRLVDREAHEKICEYRMEQCINPGCSYFTTSKEKLIEHIGQDCLMQKVPCPYLDKGCVESEIPRFLLQKHLEFCQYAPKICEKCGALIEEKLSGHKCQI